MYLHVSSLIDFSLFLAFFLLSFICDFASSRFEGLEVFDELATSVSQSSLFFLAGAFEFFFILGFFSSKSSACDKRNED